MLSAYPTSVRADATAFILFLGLPNQALGWSIAGTGGIIASSPATDAQGRGYAVYQPGTPDTQVSITVAYGS